MTLASTNNALPEDGVTAPKTHRSYFNVNFNTVFLRQSLVHSLVNKNDSIKMHDTNVKRNVETVILFIVSRSAQFYYYLCSALASLSCYLFRCCFGRVW